MSEVPGTGRVIADRYRLLDPLGEGRAGIVWRARDEVLGREVAVKEVPAPVDASAGGAGRPHSRLEREARTAARVSHRNVVAVHDVVVQDSRPWIVMDLVRGLALSDVLDADGPLSPRRAARIGAEVLAALRGGHEAGVLHRDVRPGNVLLANDGRVMLKDFGITTAREGPAPTATGEPAGSPGHLAPECARGRAPGPESDLWSLGVLLYAATEGQSPFGGGTPGGSADDDEPLPLRRAGALAPVIEGLLRSDPAERLTAAEAERRLRILAAGGTGSPGGGAAGPPPVPTSGEDSVAGGSEPAEGMPEPVGRTKRTGVLVAVGVVVSLLVAGALAWALTDDDGTDGRSDGKAVTSTSASGAPAPVPVRQNPSGAHGEGTP
ncbi:serine/threonine-protein kinase [Streptomyces sp. HB132]|uniref:serine/threonine-protein kinase n=1 Tax=Streptomyces sp. HB132 TaxID=767388 RepID=UPI0019613BA6|nr:serine/threonine-protein kinase [Streptomyces sp. HB132]MBM7442138.1 serine/threonine protein kinase [Streptomyces sp. HB132]